MSFISKNVVEIEIASIYGVHSITASPRTMSIPNPHGQDLPPRGAYPEIQFKVSYPYQCHLLIIASPSRTRIQCRNRVTRRRGNNGVGTSKITGGHRRTTVSPIVHAIHLGIYDADDSELFRESQWARLHLIPLLEAENDRLVRGS